MVDMEQLTLHTPAPTIVATAQQSRFDSALLDPTAIAELELETVHISIDQKDLLVDASIKLKDGLRYALVGPNGAGKSTILQAIADRLIPGIPESLRILLVSQTQQDTQNPHASGSQSAQPSVIQYVIDGHKERTVLLETHRDLSKAIETTDRDEGFRLYAKVMLDRADRELVVARRYAARRSGARGKAAREEEILAERKVEEAEATLRGAPFDAWEADAAELLADAQTGLELLDSDTIEAQAIHCLKGLGFSTARMQGPYTALSGGWRSRAALAIGLLVPSDLLLLDEPSNYMDLESITFLETHLQTLPCTTVVTSHDQAFLDAVAERTVLLRRQKLEYFDGSPSSMLDAERKKRLGNLKQSDALQKKKDHIQSSISEAKKAARTHQDDKKARTAKSRQKKLDERFGLERSAEGFRFKLNRDMAGYHLANRDAIEVEALDRPALIKLESPAPLKQKGPIVHLDKVSLKYKGAAKEVLKDVQLTVNQGERMALIGKNGHGKTTLARIIAGDLRTSAGSVERHPAARIGYYTQHSADELSKYDDSTALRWLMQVLPEVQEAEARRVLGSWGLQGRLASHVPIGLLSGGQRVRLVLSRLMYSCPDLLILDEITTHLDYLTIRGLAFALRRYTGALVLITHDRWFARVVIEGADVEEEETEQSVPPLETKGRTWVVSKGGVSEVRSMEEYEASVRRKQR